MKHLLIYLFLFITTFTYTQTPGEWTWMSGDNTNNSPGSYGTQGVPSPNNSPQCLYEACQWTDFQGNFWVYGGDGVTSSDDLWKFNPITLEWTWVKGTGLSNQPPIYGSQGVPSINNTPGTRYWGSATWTDSNNDLWLYGGRRGDVLGDLWRYNIATNEWTWMKGSSFGNYQGSYGIIGVSSPSNNPSGRAEVVGNWTDNSNNLWLFGGEVPYGRLNDLWKYDITTNEWTWMKGSNSLNLAPIYGIKGVPSVTNDPGSREAYTLWKDLNGDLWLFGGIVNGGEINDVWKYNIASNSWAWMGGSSTVSNMGNSGNKCTSSVSFLPSSRFENRACWTDDCSNLYTFGGGLPIGFANDLWHYNVTTYEWTWINGSLLTNQQSIFGVKGISSPLNVPGNRAGALSWKDKNGNLWMFGGLTMNGNAMERANDMWRYIPDPNCPFIGNTGKKPFGNDTVICGDSILLDALNPGSTYLWSTGVATQTISVILSGVYSVTITNSSFCNPIIDTIQVTFIPYPVVNLGNDTNLCEGNSLTLNAGNPGCTYKWSTSSTTQTINISSQGTYAVTVDNQGCTASDVIIINTFPPPIVDLGNDTSLCGISSLTLDAKNPDCIYSWTTGNATQTIVVTAPGNYTVSVTCSPCPTVIDDINIDFTSGVSALFFPNTFTPETNGLNDIFKGVGEGVAAYNLKIFTRWGELIFKSKDSNIGWDGKYKGRLCPNDMYVWVVDYTFICEPEKKLRKYGNVFLLK